MRALTRLLAIVTLMIVAPIVVPGMAAVAGQQTGTISYLIARDSDGLIYFNMTGSATGKPPCASNTYWIIRNENSEAGKRQYAMLMLAYAMGTTITVYGADTCTRWVNGEDVNAVMLASP